MKFNPPFDLEVGCWMVRNHHCGGGMEFYGQLPGGDTLMVTSIISVNTGLSVPIFESLDDLKHQHTQEVMNIQEHYACLSVTSVHCVAFQSTTAVLLSEEGNGVLGYICWSEDLSTIMMHTTKLILQC